MNAEFINALEALEKEKNISIAILDAYSVKPLDRDTLKKVADASGKKIITVEDHYIQGGLGQAVTYAVRNQGYTINCLAVTQLPRSGTPEELMAWAGIDAQAIVQMVQKLS